HSRRHDHYRRQRIECRTGAFGRRARLHPQALHARTSPGARYPAFECKMKSAKELPAKNRIPPHWPSLLHLAIEEVFEIMLGAKLDAYAGLAPTHDLTAMVGLA